MGPHVDNEGGVPKAPQRHGGKDRPVKAMGLLVKGHFFGAAVKIVRAVRDAVQKVLNGRRAVKTTIWILQSAGHLYLVSIPSACNY
jgi:hypothetical protein